MKLLKMVLATSALTIFTPLANAAVIDTNNTVNASIINYWPWGDADNNSYQLYLSESMMQGNTGIIDSITHFATSPKNDGSVYDLNVYISSTNLSTSGLSTNMSSNHGADKTLVFSGSTTLASSQINIDIDNVYNYTGGNLVIEYAFNGFTGVGNFYDGPAFESVSSNTKFWRVTDHAIEGSIIYDQGAIRTQMMISAVPEPSTYALMIGGLGLVGLMAARRKKA